MRPLFSAIARPIQAFLQLEAASGIVLLASAVAALAWVNVLGAESYHAVFDRPITLALGDAAVRFTVHHVVNDGLMTVFFLVVGMEIKRELSVGELRRRAQAMLPALAALGGMIVPAALFVAWNRSGPGRQGWGIPVATDIAFCVGVVTLLGKRVPHPLVVFLTAPAIFDDIGGILIIALFYGSGLQPAWLLGAAAVGAVLAWMSRRGVASAAAYTAIGALLWYAVHGGGVHGTIAGVLVGLAIPARARSAPREVLEALARHVEERAQAL